MNNQNISVEKIIKELNLSPHPEGGYFREIYRGDEQVERDDGSTSSVGTGIHFLLPEGICTNWHRVNCDELWHFFRGDLLALEMIDADGAYHRKLLSGDFFEESSFQELVPKNCWQRAYSTGKYSLVGCTVNPGFEFDNFEMIEADALPSQFSDHEAEILNNPFS